MKLELKGFYQVAFAISILGIVAFIFDFGFSQTLAIQTLFNAFYFIVLLIGISTTVLRYIQKSKSLMKKVILFDSLTIIYSVIIMLLHLWDGYTYKNSSFLFDDYWIKFAVILTFIREFSEVNLNFKRNVLNPAQLFIASFLFIILLGAFLLMMPNATVNGITFMEALFTSTSAVCVTGLIVVDTATYFTELGKYIIMFLIQIGGLGILTIASYFSYFFKGVSTYENQLSLSDMTSSKNLGQVYTTIKYILLITLSIELFSAVLIYLSLDSSLFQSQYNQIFFSIFHAVSAFCNAGFSTLTNNLYEEGYKYNYFLHMVISLTLVMGGLGFPIVANLMKYLRYKINSILFFPKGKVKYKPWVLNLDSRIIIKTTLILIVSSFALFYVFEYNNSLAKHDFIGKIVTAFFGATTPRTAGFNTVDMATLTLPTAILTIFLMWIGASPASTGGGIKTSTFALAFLNIIALAQGKTRIEIYRREISDMTIMRAFAIMALSLVVIATGILLISFFDPNKGLLNIAFECFSAYSTVGLSLGATPSLSDPSRFVLIVIMFIGRVSMLSIMIAVFKKEKYKNYRFPTEEVTIN